jgi:type II secretory pathway pseudopilin PulG
MKKLRKLLTNREHGYSLLEMSVAVGIMVIGMAVAIPSFNNALNTQEANDLSNNMLSSGMVMENSRFQNNGTYPNEIPIELSENPAYAAFSYSIDKDGQNYCIMGRDGSGQKYFLSSDGNETYTPSETQDGCTEENIIWSPTNGEPTPNLMISAPSIAGGTNIWNRNNYSSAVASFSWTSGSCVFDGPLASNMSGVGETTYQARVYHPSTSNIFGETGFDNFNSLANISLEGVLPTSDIQYQVRMRCLADYEYRYSEWVSLSDTVATFPVDRTYIVASPAPKATWATGQEAAVLNFSVAAITCPSSQFTPVYRASITQSGSSTINVEWNPSSSFSIALVGFAGASTATITPYSACEVNGIRFEGNESMVGGPIPISENEVSIPVPPPSPVTDLTCVTKYDRLTESSSGDCVKQANFVSLANIAPNGLTWTQSTCPAGTTDHYRIRTAIGQAPSESAPWTNLGPNISSFAFDSAFPIGARVYAEVVAYCKVNISGGESENSVIVSEDFLVDYAPPSNQAIQIKTWTPSTNGAETESGWNTTSLVGDSYMYDRMTGTASSTCSNNILPSGWNIRVTTVYPDGSSTAAANLVYVAGASPVFDRTLSGASQGWVSGAAIQLEASAVCPSFNNVYQPVTTLPDQKDAAVNIGYHLTGMVVTGVNCVSKHERTTEAVKGGCTYDASVASQATVPNAIKWSPVVCLTGYTPSYVMKISSGGGGASINVGSSLIHPLVGQTPDISYNYAVEFSCTASNGRFSEASSPSANRSFITSAPPSTVVPAPATYSIVPSTADTSWTPTTVQGSSFLYDRFTITASGTSCPAGYSLKGVGGKFNSDWQVFENNFTTSYSQTTPFPSGLGGSREINRSSETMPGWVEGALINISPTYDCLNPDYVAVLTSAEGSSSNQTEIGVGAPVVAISGYNCFNKTVRSTEASKGACIQDSSIDSNTSPQELRWNGIDGRACAAKLPGSSPRYFLVYNTGATLNTPGNATPVSTLTAGRYITVSSLTQGKGSAGTSPVIASALSVGTQYTFGLSFDCFKSSDGRFTGMSELTPKTFIASHPYSAPTTPSISWSANTTSSGSWSTASNNGSEFLDTIVGTVSSSGCPTGYSMGGVQSSVIVANDPSRSASGSIWSSGGYTTTAPAPASNILLYRDYNTGIWNQGAGIYAYASLYCTGGDYGTITTTTSNASPTYNLAVQSPTNGSISGYRESSLTARYDVPSGNFCTSMGGGANHIKDLYSYFGQGSFQSNGSVTNTSASWTSSGNWGGQVLGEVYSRCVNPYTGRSSANIYAASGWHRLQHYYGNVVNVTATAPVGQSTISGNYARACQAGSNFGGGLGYYGYNGTGISGTTFNGTGFRGSASLDDAGSWRRTGYGSTYVRQIYGFRIGGQSCTNAWTGGRASHDGWATFYIKQSLNKANGSGYWAGDW